MHLERVHGLFESHPLLPLFGRLQDGHKEDSRMIRVVWVKLQVADGQRYEIDG